MGVEALKSTVKVGTEHVCLKREILPSEIKLKFG